MISSWNYGEPTSLRGEQCGEMNIQGKLNDQKCDSFNPFICEQYRPTFSPPSKTTVATTTEDQETVEPNSTTINPVHTVKTNETDRNVEKPKCDPLEEYDTSWPSVSKGEAVSPCKTGTSTILYSIVIVIFIGFNVLAVIYLQVVTPTIS